MDYLVDCIIKRPHHHGPHYGIEQLGGPDNGQGMRWKDTRAKVIDSIERHGHNYYTRHGNGRQYIRVVDGTHGKYLRTYADDTPTDNLLNQNTCPQ
jgi:Protein of unknown function (DUF3892)